MELFFEFEDILNIGLITLCDGSTQQLKSFCDYSYRFMGEEEIETCEISYDTSCDVARLGLTYDREVTIGRKSAFWDAIDVIDGLHVESHDEFGKDGIQISLDLVCWKV